MRKNLLKAISITALAMVFTAAWCQEGPPPMGEGPQQGGRMGGPRRGGMRGPMMMAGPMLLLNPQVRAELKLTDDQITKIRALAPARGPRMGGPEGEGPDMGRGGPGGPEGREEFGGPGGPGGEGPEGPGGPEGRPEGRPGGRDGHEMEAKIKGILDSKQFVRYQQISLQVEGPRAFSRPDIAKKLGLSEDQEDQIRDILDANRPQGRPMGGEEEDGPRPMRGRENDKAQQKKVLSKIINVLAPEQKAKWDKLVGTTFELKAQKG